MLGYGDGTFTRESQFGNAPGGNFGMDDVKCSGSETDIRDCSHVTHDDCGAGEAAGAICSNYLGSDAESSEDPLGELFFCRLAGQLLGVWISSLL